VINREEGRRVVEVTAELNRGVASPRGVITSLKEDVLPEFRKKYPELSTSMVGTHRERKESFQVLGQNFILIQFVLFALLAIPFRSYVQPLIVMSAIPFGFVGAVMGHLIMGYNLSFMSLFGIIALSGVVVNDSLVLIDSVNKARQSGQSALEALVNSGMRRMRPILLTSLTTFGGLAPMILETSVQARFLIPMAISLGFGVLFATFITLLLVPALYLIVEDVRSRFGQEVEAKAVPVISHG
jgi:multidrug efflux pump subunit AcrB